MTNKKYYLPQYLTLLFIHEFFPFRFCKNRGRWGRRRGETIIAMVLSLNFSKSIGRDPFQVKSLKELDIIKRNGWWIFSKTGVSEYIISFGLFWFITKRAGGSDKTFFIVKKVYPVYNPSVCTKLLLMQVLYRVWNIKICAWCKRLYGLVH